MFEIDERGIAQSASSECDRMGLRGAARAATWRKLCRDMRREALDGVEELNDEVRQFGASSSFYDRHAR